jgi:hypothetical protein
VIPIPQSARPVAIARVETMNAIAPELRASLAADLRAATSGWNAVAVGTSGQIGTRLGAKSEREAVDGAVAECDRKDRACRVMVIGPFVVEPLPDTQAGHTPEINAAPTSASAKPEELEPLLAALSSAVPALEQQTRDAAKEYAAAKPHKALALVPGTNRYSFEADFPSAEHVEEFALETCQLLHGVPCALIALDGAVQARPADGKWQTHDMPRVRYAGQFDPERIPGLPRLGHQVARRADIALYGAASGPKAAAIHGNDTGRLFIEMTATSQREAERRALSDCNADPARAGVACYLYAVGDRVIFPEHRSEPVTP